MTVLNQHSMKLLIFLCVAMIFNLSEVNHTCNAFHYLYEYSRGGLYREAFSILLCVLASTMMGLHKEHLSTLLYWGFLCTGLLLDLGVHHVSVKNPSEL